MADVALLAAADTLSRAADLIEKLAKLADAPGETQWFTVEELVATDDFHKHDAALIAKFGPHALAALVPALRAAAETAPYVETLGRTRLTAMVSGLAEFARRLLREEET